MKLNFLSLLAHNFFYYFLTRKVSLVRLGDKCPWTIVPNLKSDSFVISGGAGDDISFELELAENFACEVWLFDPSEAGESTFSKIHNKPDKLFFFLEGLDSKGGTTTICRPEDGDPTTHSWTISGTSGGVAVATRSLKEILVDSGRSRIDLLKIDIEGFEYPVLRSALDYKIPISQICVEIHQGPRFNNKTRRDRWSLIFRLLKHGYRLVHHTNWDHTFLHKSLIK